MSQHLITQFIKASHVFKPIKGERLVSHKLKKYESSNRNNNNSPKDVAVSIHNLQKINVEKETPRDPKATSVIDITV